MSEDPKNPFEPEPDFFSNPESFASESNTGEPLADFFDDAASFTEPGPLEPFPPVVEDTVLSHTHAHFEEEEPLAPRPVHQPVPTKAAATKPKAESDANPKVLPASISMLLLGGALVGGGIGIGKFLPGSTEPAPAAAPAAPTGGATPAPAPTPTATAPEPASAEELKTLAAKVDAISKSVEQAAKSFTGLETKVAALPKPAPPADLKPIETKIAAIETKLGDLAGKPATPAPTAMPDLKPIEAKVDGLAKTVTAIPSQVDALKAKIESQEKTIAALKAELSQKPAPAAVAASSGATNAGMPATPSPTTPAVDAEAAIDAAMVLYSQNQFGPARDAFVKLQSVAPNDARVWYYSALSNGFATNQWAEGSDTTRYATRGVEREKAGTPDRSKIDAAFTQLRPDAKGWLDAYRAQAR